MWDELYPAERARILRLSVERRRPPTVSPSRYMPPGFAALSRSWPTRGLLLRPPPKPCWRPQNNDRASRSRTRYPDHLHPDAASAPRRPEADHGPGGGGEAGAEAAPDDTIIKALLRAHRWRRRIESGQAKSITDLAEQEGVTDAYVCRLLPLTCLAPDIVEVILDGRQPKGLRLAEVLGNGPLAWEEQRSDLSR